MKRITATALTATSLTLAALAFTPCSAQERQPKETSAIAQPGRPTAAHAAMVAKAQADQAALRPTVTLEFHGGTLADLVREMRQATADLTVIIPELADRVSIPKLSLRGAPVGSVFDAITRLPDPQFMIDSRVLRVSAGSRPVYSVQIHKSSRQKVNKSKRIGGRPEVVEVFSIRRLVVKDARSGVEVFTTQTVLTAIDAGVSVTEGKAPTIKFHASTGLLIVSGSPNQVAIVGQIVRILDRDIDMRYVRHGINRKPAAAKDTKKSAASTAAKRR